MTKERAGLLVCFFIIVVFGICSLIGTAGTELHAVFGSTPAVATPTAKVPTVLTLPEIKGANGDLFTPNGGVKVHCSLSSIKKLLVLDCEPRSSNFYKTATMYTKNILVLYEGYWHIGRYNIYVKYANNLYNIEIK
jgi:hypothetical protein